MPTRNATAQWEGSVQEGSGTMRLGTGAFQGPYSFRSRMQDGTGTNPEELIAAAHAGCFSMALSAGLGRAGTPPTRIDTTAEVRFEEAEGGWSITGIHLRTRAVVPGLDSDGFTRAAEDAKAGCPVSKALAAVPITLDASLDTSASR